MPRRHAEFRQAAIDIIRRLRDNGHVALLAGGCVRDMLLGLDPKDYDVATDAVPQRVVELFQRTRQVGAQFGVVLVKERRIWVEVATFRSDHSYEDGRHPVSVTFSDPESDAARRDFTINGMFLDPLAEEVIDYVGGQRDLRAGIIRTIGPAPQRFAEDHLRLIRAVRFAGRFEYTIEPETREAIREHAAMITRVSAERIREELEKILKDAHRAAAVRLLADVGLLDHLWPGSEWTGERIDLSAAMLEKLPKRTGFVLPLACLLIHWPRQEVNSVCRELTCSNDVRKRVVWLVERIEALTDAQALGLADLKLLMQSPDFGNLETLTGAWLEATGRSTEAYRRIVERASEVSRDEIAPEPLIDGDDLIAMGLSPGPLFSTVLDRVYRAQLEGGVTTKAEATAMAKGLADGSTQEA
ncbi:MAG: CCA tRNA nucleotidyltransferase [Phycisphaerae bacterium]|nr:CCA tRNA nucleotidyltransferase [Phycisphaerae bacterium]